MLQTPQPVARPSGQPGRPVQAGAPVAPPQPKPLVRPAAPAVAAPNRDPRFGVAAPAPVNAPPPVAAPPPAAPTVPGAVPQGTGPTMPAPPAPPAPAAPPPMAPPVLGPGDSWERTKATLGGMGDEQLDLALKNSVMQGLSSNPFDDANLANAQTSAFESGMADLKGTRGGMEGDLVRRGLSNTGIGAELGMEAEQAARAGIAGTQRQNALDFKEKGAAAKREAINQAQTLASDLARRGVDIENLKMQREQFAAQMARSGGGGGGDESIEIVNPDGSVSTIPLNILDLVLGMEEGGLE